MVPKIQELHENLDIILNKLGISTLEFSYSSDIKMCMFFCDQWTFKIKSIFSFLVYTLIGKSSSGSQTHGCPFGDGKGPQFTQCKLYTLGELINYHEVKKIGSFQLYFNHCV